MLRFYLPLTKVDKEQRMVYGYASTEARDSEGEIITLEALQTALPDYMKFANIREMHQLSAVGVAKEAEVDDKGLYIGVKVVDDDAWLKVTEGVYKGFSIGGKCLARDTTDPRTITELELIEISLVDRPANPEALIEVFKADTGGDLKKTSDSEKPSKAEPSRQPCQIWNCGIPGHEHVSKAEATGCILKQDAAFGPNTTAVELRKTIAEAVAALDGRALVRCVSYFMKGRKDVEKGEVTYLPPAYIKDGRIVIPDETMNAIKEFVEGAKTAKADKDNKKPEGDYGPHSEAGYADPGYQADGKPRYPLKKKGTYNEGRIRAAWDYINHPDNQKAYTKAQVKSIKNRIIAAWKEAIDPNGPPSAEGSGGTSGKEKASTMTTKEKAAQAAEAKQAAQTFLKGLGKADSTGDIKKGLYTVSCAINLLESLDRIVESLEIEAAREGDESPMPTRFHQLLQMMAELVEQLLSEEVEEMLTDKEAEDFDPNTNDYYIYYAQQASKLAAKGSTPEGFAARIYKAVGERTGDPGAAALLAFAKAVEQTQEWGAHGESEEQDHDDAWKEQAQSIHDAAVSMGAKCMSKAAHEDLGKKKKAKEEDDKDEEKAEEEDEDDKKEDKKSKKKAAKEEDDDKEKAEEDDEDDKEEDKKSKKKASGDLDVLKTLAQAITDLSDKVDALSAGRAGNPKKPALKAVDKAEDFSRGDEPEDVLKDPAKAKDPRDVLKAILNRGGQVIGR